MASCFGMEFIFPRQPQISLWPTSSCRFGIARPPPMWIIVGVELRPLVSLPTWAPCRLTLHQTTGLPCSRGPQYIPSKGWGKMADPPREFPQSNSLYVRKSRGSLRALAPRAQGHPGQQPGQQYYQAQSGHKQTPAKIYTDQRRYFQPGPQHADIPNNLFAAPCDRNLIGKMKCIFVFMSIHVVNYFLVIMILNHRIFIICHPRYLILDGDISLISYLHMST